MYAVNSSFKLFLTGYNGKLYRWPCRAMWQQELPGNIIGEYYWGITGEYIPAL
jgi:hypothetical protein